MEIEKKLRVLKLSNDMDVSIKFEEVLTTESEHEDGENGIIGNIFTVDSKHKPHKDLIDGMKKLRKYALEVCEIPVDNKETPKWIVSKIKISGDVLSQTSRVVMTVSKEVKTGKVISITTPQVTMYPTAEDKVPYQNADKMTAEIESVINEVWLYLNGKYETEGQLPLFLFAEKEAVHA